jgi:FKBP-type peptidyl-prolyl cis-trans isomerase SlyD
MQIENNKVVSFLYHLRDAEGTALEESEPGLPLAYLHGHNNLLPALEEALTGRSAGDRFSVTLPPEKAYGPLVPGKTQRIPIKHIVNPPKRLLPDMIIHVQTEQGPIPAKVIKVGKFMVDVDLNHPFAGKTLEFQVEVVSVRDATEDEIAHGHAHGDGGHHH